LAAHLLKHQLSPIVSQLTNGITRDKHAFLDPESQVLPSRRISRSGNQFGAVAAIATEQKSVATMMLMA